MQAPTRVTQCIKSREPTLCRRDENGPPVIYRRSSRSPRKMSVGHLHSTQRQMATIKWTFKAVVGTTLLGTGGLQARTALITTAL